MKKILDFWYFGVILEDVGCFELNLILNVLMLGSVDGCFSVTPALLGC